MAAFGKHVSMSCVVTDITATGARLRFGGGVSLPPRFDLALAKTGELLDVRLVWQRGRDAGVQFGPTIPERLRDFISRLPFMAPRPLPPGIARATIADLFWRREPDTGVRAEKSLPEG